MKILLTVHQFFPKYAAGTEVLTYSVARELMRLGHEVHVFTGHPSSPDMHEDDRFDEYDFEGIHVYRFHHAYISMAGQTSMIEVGYDNRLATKYWARILEKFKPDLVHFFHLNRLGSGLIDFAVSAGIPAFMTPTDFWSICPTVQLVLNDGTLCSGPSAYAGNCVKHFVQNSKDGVVGKIVEWLPVPTIDLLVRLTQAKMVPPYPKKIEVRAIGSRLSRNITRLNQLNRIISPNSFMTKKLLQYGVFPSLIVQSTFGIDVIEPQKKQLHQLPHKPLRIGYIGTLVQHKGCHVLIEAFKALPNGLAVLSIYGSTEEIPEYSSELKQLIVGSEVIELCGTFHNSKIGEVLACLDVLVVPSLWYENTPLVVYSAQAAGCAVVASDFPGISEVVQDDVNGLLFEAGNVHALTSALTKLIDEPSLLTRLSINCKQPKSTSTYVDELLSIWKGN